MAYGHFCTNIHYNQNATEKALGPYMFKTIKRMIEIFKHPPDPNWYIEKQGKPSKAYPLGGFWKKDLKHDHGLAIGKAPEGLYFIIEVKGKKGFEKYIRAKSRKNA
jgi:hypothetical protein